LYDNQKASHSYICNSLQSFKVISFNHQNLPLESIGKLHLSEDSQSAGLGAIKEKFYLNELMFLSTCNRVELYLCSDAEMGKERVKEIIGFINSTLCPETITELTDKVLFIEGEEAVKHVFKVASSLNSLVVGEREIITQLRKAYDFCNLLGLTGDFIRLLMKQTIQTAKLIFTETGIAKNPVSVVSLAYRQLRDLGIRNDARIIIVGAGETNTKMANYLKKHKFANFNVFNRSIENAKKLSGLLNGTAQTLEGLTSFSSGFDVLIVCTSSAEPIITKNIYTGLLGDDLSKKVLIDLSTPHNIHDEVINNFSNYYIDISSLKNRAEQNLQLRLSEMEKCAAIIDYKLQEFKHMQRERQIELAFGEIPRQVKAIKEIAMNEVFVRELNGLDPSSKDLLDKVIGYMEKKYNAVAMKTAKDVFLKDE